MSEKHCKQTQMNGSCRRFGVPFSVCKAGVLYGIDGNLETVAVLLENRERQPHLHMWRSGNGPTLLASEVVGQYFVIDLNIELNY